jgi:hypothetical protein
MSERLDTRARRLVDLKDKYQRLTREAEAAEKAYREEERELWMDIYDEHGDVKTITLNLGEGYGTIALGRRETITATILNQEQAVKALEEAGLDDATLGPPTLRKKVLNEFARDWNKSGEQPPEGLDIHARRYIQVTRKDKT